MKLCTVCQHCYADTDTACVHEGHAPLVPSRPGARLIAGKYLLDWRISHGITGSVYAGTHVDRDRSVAIKLLLPEFFANPQTRERFEREVRAITQLQHPNVARVYDYGALPDGEAYLVVEWVSGRTLSKYMQAAGSLPFRIAAAMAGQIADGLAAAHRCGLLHGGLKPSNIILTGEPQDCLQIKIVGLGMAALKEQAILHYKSTLLSDDMLLEVLRYTSPEPSGGQAPDARSDVYSLGVILYEMLSGRLPLDAPTTTALKVKQVLEDPPLLKDFRSDVPDVLAQLILEALHKNPAVRPQTAAEMARRLHYLEELIAPLPPLSSEISEWYPSAPPPSARAAFPLSVRQPKGGQTNAPSSEITIPRLEDRSWPSTEYGADGLGAGDLANGSGAASGPRALSRSRPETRALSSASMEMPAWPKYRVPRVPRLLYASLFLALALIGGALWLARMRATSSPSPSQTLADRLPQFSRPRMMRIYPPTISDAPGYSPSTGNMGNTGAGSSGQAALSGVTAQASAIPDGAMANSWLSAAETARGAQPILAMPARPTATPKQGPSAALQVALQNWVAATNARDMQKHMSLYAPTITTFYRAHNISRSAVLAEKARLFSQESRMDVRAADPKITLSPNGRMATMRFRKIYPLGDRQSRYGEVGQEMCWLRTDAGWKIISEREIPLSD